MPGQETRPFRCRGKQVREQASHAGDSAELLPQRFFLFVRRLFAGLLGLNRLFFRLLWATQPELEKRPAQDGFGRLAGLIVQPDRTGDQQTDRDQGPQPQQDKTDHIRPPFCASTMFEQMGKKLR